jgi:hypothetical protein
MGFMKGIYGDLVAGIQSIEVYQKEQEESLVGINRRLDSLLHFMSDMVKMESRIESMERTISERLDRMAAAQMDSGKLVDRLIEMSLVNRGQGDQAAIHRSQSRLESNFSNPQSWEGDKESEEDVWPPRGCDAMDIVG